MTSLDQNPLISSISIRDLFGTRDYDIIVPEVDGRPSRLLLLHGDNGSGKTTLLRLVWHALSASESRGHRTFLAKTPFSSLAISMLDGSELYIRKLDGLLGSFEISLLRPGRDAATSKYMASDDHKILRSRNDRVRALQRIQRAVNSASEEMDQFYAELEAAEESQRGEQDYLQFLLEEVGSPLYLADDRSLYSDDPDIERMREILSAREDIDRRDRLARLAIIELRITIRRVNEHLRSITLGGQNDGSANANAIYVDVLRSLLGAPKQSGEQASTSHVTELLDEISEIGPGYERYGLVPKFDTRQFRELLDRAQVSALGHLAERVIEPFLFSLRARYAALEEAHGLLSSLVPTINRFLNGKQLRFSPRGGLEIVTTNGETLDVEKLSSGERQLLMLMCTTLMASFDTKVFIIDEPELSLGVEWQRNILDALTGMTERTGLQFIVATHSVEIISTRPEALAQLRQI